MTTAKSYGRTHMTKKNILAALLAAVLALSLAACGGGATDDTPEEEPSAAGIAVQVEEISPDTIYAENTVSGQLAAEDQIGRAHV